MPGALESGGSAALKGAAALFALLGRALYAVPDKAWLDSLIEQELFAGVPFGGTQADVRAGLALLREWSEANRGGLSQPVFEALLADHTRLFVGPGKLLAAPWESVYADKDRLLFQAVTVDVRDWYARFGLERSGACREPEDHVGMELGFIGHLARLTLEALEIGDVPRFQELVEAQRDFLERHALRWVPRWCREMEAHACSDFYRGLARLAQGALKELEATLEPMR